MSSLQAIQCAVVLVTYRHNKSQRKKNPNPEREQGISATAWAVESPDGLDPELAANSASVDVLYSVMRFVNLQLQLQCIEQCDGKSKLCSHGL